MALAHAPLSARQVQSVSEHQLEFGQLLSRLPRGAAAAVQKSYSV
jgi:hypothetical protein